MSEVWQAKDFFGEVIHRYTRAEAIADGVLVELDTKMASEAGWKIPVACTIKVWEEVINWDNNSEEAFQDIEGRLWDVLLMAGMGVRKSGAEPVTHFKMMSIPRHENATESREITLKAVIEGGGNGEPVVTIMGTDEKYNKNGTENGEENGWNKKPGFAGSQG